MQDDRKNLPIWETRKRGKGEKNTNKSGEERRYTYVQHQINAQVNEDICLAAPPVNFGHVPLAGKTADADTDLLWEKNTIISLKQYGW